ncbi:MAG: hypothetical protein HPM95_04720 [Alphaproteobacteria bacterium]|nr:hypothetical protein [Alphaproteobacteria bacterium]
MTSSAASIPHVAKAAALGALRAPALFSRRNVEECRRRIALVCDLVRGLDARLRTATRLNAPMVTVGHEVEAGHSVLLEFPCLAGHDLSDGGAPRDGADLTRLFLNEAKVAFAPALSHGFDGPRVRANVASIGTQFTYDASRVWEAREDDSWGEEQERAFDGGFARARDLISSTFAERIEPAVFRLLGQAPEVARSRRQRSAAAAFATGQGGAVSRRDGAGVAETATAIQPALRPRSVRSAVGASVAPALRPAMAEAPAEPVEAMALSGLGALFDPASGAGNPPLAALVDVWGVLTDGARAFVPAIESLKVLRARGVPVALVSNTSRRGGELARLLEGQGLASDLHDAVITGGGLAFGHLSAEVARQACRRRR